MIIESWPPDDFRRAADSAITRVLEVEPALLKYDYIDLPKLVDRDELTVEGTALSLAWLALGPVRRLKGIPQAPGSVHWWARAAGRWGCALGIGEPVSSSELIAACVAMAVPCRQVRGRGSSLYLGLKEARNLVEVDETRTLLSYLKKNH